MDSRKNDINLRYASPVVVSDGNVVMISDQGVPSLLFFQAREQHEGHLHGEEKICSNQNGSQAVMVIAQPQDKIITIGTRALNTYRQTYPDGSAETIPIYKGTQGLVVTDRPATICDGSQSIDTAQAPGVCPGDPSLGDHP